MSHPDPTRTYEEDEEAFNQKSKAKTKALNDAVDKKYNKLNAAKGLTPKGKRKWHYYNTKIK